MDDDGNVTSTGEFKKNGRKPQQKDSNSARKDNGEVRRQEVPGVPKTTDAAPQASKPKDIPSSPAPERASAKANTCRNYQQRQKTHDQSGEVRRQVAAPRALKPFDATRKTSKPQDVPSTQVAGRPSARATSHGNTQQRHKPSGVLSKPCPSREDVSKDPEELSYRHKLEVAKRKLQDRYQEAKDAKRQRTIQVMELKDLPKQGLNKQQLNLKRGNYFRRSVNMKSK